MRCGLPPLDVRVLERPSLDRLIIGLGVLTSFREVPEDASPDFIKIRPFKMYQDHSIKISQVNKLIFVSLFDNPNQGARQVSDLQIKDPAAQKLTSGELGRI